MHEPLPPAPLWRRLTAFAYDLLALVGLWIFITLVAVAVNGGPIGSAIVDGHVRVVDLAAQIGLYTLLWLVTGLYYTLSWRYGGQTLGMRPWRVQAQAADGTPGMAFGRAWLRYLCATLAVLPLGLGLWWSLLDHERLALHDRLSGTRLALLPKP